MKFNFVSHGFLGPQQGFENIDKRSLAGGGEIYLFNLCQELIGAGHEVTVIQAGKKFAEFVYRGINIRQIKLPGVSRFVKFYPERFSEFNYIFPKYIDKNVDRIHLNYLQHAHRIKRDNVTATCHGIEWDMPEREYLHYNQQLYSGAYRLLLPYYHKLYMRWYKNTLTKKSIENVSKLVSVDSFLYRYIQSELPEHRQKVIVIPSFVDLHTFDPNQVYKRRFPNNRRVILFPRNITFNRGIHYALSSIHRLKRMYPDILLAIVGDGPAKPWADRYIKTHRLGKWVEILQHQDHTDMPELMASSDIVIIPTAYSEGMALALLEAMAMKKPIVTTHIGGLYDVAKNRVNSLVVQPNGLSLSKAIATLFDNPQLARTIAINAQLDSKSYSKDKWRDSYFDFFGLNNRRS